MRVSQVQLIDALHQIKLGSRRRCGRTVDAGTRKTQELTLTHDTGAPAIVERYKALADIERGFRVLKSEIDIAPVYHRLPQRIRAHASLCFMALILYRVMRNRLRAAGSTQSPESVLAGCIKRQGDK